MHNGERRASPARQIPICSDENDAISRSPLHFISGQSNASGRMANKKHTDKIAASPALNATRIQGALPKAVPSAEYSSGHLERSRLTDPPAELELISGPKLRARLGISAVTLWRWRHDPNAGFPVPKVINGRLYFSACLVFDWIAKQSDAE